MSLRSRRTSTRGRRPAGGALVTIFVCAAAGPALAQTVAAPAAPAASAAQVQPAATHAVPLPQVTVQAHKPRPRRTAKPLPSAPVAPTVATDTPTLPQGV